MGVLRVRVRLADIVPSGQNPRRDFGDIQALARAIESTGGEPVNPPVLVADGNVFRIVDGERRYRALRELYGADPDREVAALVYDGFEEANEVVAMLATDDKRRLSESERARGVQQMLLLGVDTERVVKASRATRGQVAAAKMMAGRVPEGQQVTLDQMLAASDLPDEMADEVLSAGDGWQGVACRLRSAVRAKEVRRAVEAAVGRAVGIELVDGAPAGASFCGSSTPSDEDEAAEAVERFAAKGCRYAVVNGATCWFYLPGGDGEPDGEAARRRELVDADKAVCASTSGSLLGFVLAGGVREVPAALEDTAAGFIWGLTPWSVRNSDDRDALREVLAAGCRRSPAVLAAYIATLADEVSEGLYRWDGEPVDGRCRSFCEVYDAARLCGWEPTAEQRDRRLWAAAHARADE